MGYFNGLDDTALYNSPEEIANAVTGYAQLRNATASGIGSVFPPRLAAGSSVPVASGVQVAAVSALNGQSVVTLRWYDPAPGYTGAISAYNVYVKRAVGVNQAPQLVASSLSPAQFAFQTDSIANVVFIVQTVMANGLTSPLASSPTCTVTSADPALTPGSIPSPQVVVVGLTLANNSPGAGSVSWTSCVVYYNGAGYAVAGGNTSSPFVTWTVGANTLTAASSFTPGPTTFLILTNVAGTGDTAWNKIAFKGIQESNLSFSLLTGQLIQPVVTSAVADQYGSGAGPATTTTLLSTTGDGTHIGGGLLTVTVKVTSVRNTTVGSHCSADALQFTVDGNPAVSLPVFDADTATFNAATAAIATGTSGTGANVGDWIKFTFNVGFSTQLTVKWTTTLVPVINFNSPAGAFSIYMLYCTKTT